jgi:putative addiction module killer protein
VEAKPRELQHYETASGVDPFQDWLKKQDWKDQGRILIRLKRVESGNFGDTRPVGEGVSELKFDYGKAYRIYYGLDGDNLVILLGGGDKSTQQKDIRTAIERWREYHA